MCVFENENLSLKAKGLYAIMQRFADGSMVVLAKKVQRATKEGRAAYRSAEQELLDFGYIEIHMLLQGEPQKFCKTYRLNVQFSKHDTATLYLHDEKGNVIYKK